MARIHAHRKGKSGSTRPYLKANPEWVGMEKAEIEETIVRLHQEGLSTASIGVRLRDAYGDDMVQLFTDQLHRLETPTAKAVLWLEAIGDTLATAPRVAPGDSAPLFELPTPAKAFSISSIQSTHGATDSASLSAVRMFSSDRPTSPAKTRPMSSRSSGSR